MRNLDYVPSEVPRPEGRRQVRALAGPLSRLDEPAWLHRSNGSNAMSTTRKVTRKPYLSEPKGWNQVPATRHIVQPSDRFLTLCGRVHGGREADLTARTVALAPRICGSCERVAKSRNIWLEEV